MPKSPYCLIAVLAALLALSQPGAPAFADNPDPAESMTADGKETEQAVPQDEAVTTSGPVTIDGTRIDYDATVGLMVMKNDQDEPRATFGYTYYAKKDVARPGNRPIMFAYNGGPGSASIWLHMGVLGPQRVVIDDEAHTGPAPYGYEENIYSVLDVSDLVMLDPPGTGYSKLLAEDAGDDYWNVDGDAAVVAEFIARFTTEQGRWLSPKFMLGESYGGMRAGAVAYRLLTGHNMDLNGVIVVSPFMDVASGDDGVGMDLPHVLYLSTLAATAWYHGMIADRPDDLRAFLDEVEAFAGGEYLLALYKGNRLGQEERSRVIGKLSAFTGLDPEYWDRANLRVSHVQFLQELQRKTGITTGRIDSRYVGRSTNRLAETMNYDPYFSKVRAAYTSAFHEYMTKTLNFGRDRQYTISAGLWRSWDYLHKLPGASTTSPANTAIDLEHTIKQNPTMRVLVQQGYYDMATPYGVTDYVFDHMDLDAQERSRVITEYYEAGHMMYVHPESLEKYAEDLRRFVRESVAR